ncbi:MAG: cation diffusion facilitator family transporter [Pseudomonadota bacterium]|jgi:Co/Zn/Cd efflux system component
MSGCCAHEAVERRQRRLLWVVLTLNAMMFVVEFIAGWLAHSTSLLADSLDMLADAVVYGISLYAVGRAVSLKARAALTNGWLQLTLSLVVLGDVARRLLIDSSPEPAVMSVVSLMALAVNVTCFAALYRFRSGDINLKASWICSRNDMMANVGVMIAAMMVSRTGQAWPDLLVGTLIAAIVMRSAIQIIGEAGALQKTSTSDLVCEKDGAEPV